MSTTVKNNYASEHILTEAQLEKFMSVVMQGEVWRDFFYTELTTGLRRGEICGLRWVKWMVLKKKGDGAKIKEGDS